MIEPITLDQFKRAIGLPLDYIEEDADLEIIIESARTHLENITWSTFITRSRTAAFIPPRNRCIYLPYGPIISLTSVKYYDLDNTLQTVTTPNYFLENSNEPATLTFIEEYTFPDSYNRQRPWEVTYSAGYGAAATDIPAPIRTAVRLTAKAFYDAADCSDENIPAAAIAQLACYDLHDERTVRLA